MSPQFALVGSGEFLPVMTPIDALLLAGRNQSVAVIPTASAQDGESTFQKWITMAHSHFRKMDVEVRPIEVHDHDEATAFRDLHSITSAGFIYLSGGNPGYLAASLRGTPVWEAIAEAVANGAAIAGCSAGAMAMGALAPIVREPMAEMGPGIGMVPHVAVIPHFDKIRRWVPGIVENYLAARPAGVTIVGIDEETALVGGPHGWTVEGNKRVHVIRSIEEVDVFEPGATITLASIL
jgi:cyanophycinase